MHENFGGTTVPISLTIPSGTEKGYMTTLTVAKSRTLSISTFYLIRNLVVVNIVIQPYSVPIGIVREIWTYFCVKDILCLFAIFSVFLDASRLQYNSFFKGVGIVRWISWNDLWLILWDTTTADVFIVFGPSVRQPSKGEDIINGTRVGLPRHLKKERELLVTFGTSLFFFKGSLKIFKISDYFSLYHHMKIRFLTSFWSID